MKQLISKEKHRQIIAALKDNPNAKQVAREIGGVSHTTVGKIAKAAGIALTAGKAAREISPPELANPNYGYASRRWLVSEKEGLPGLKA